MLHFSLHTPLGVQLKFINVFYKFYVIQIQYEVTPEKKCWRKISTTMVLPLILRIMNFIYTGHTYNSFRHGVVLAFYRKEIAHVMITIFVILR
jgi:hypothetical protein